MANQPANPPTPGAKAELDKAAADYAAAQDPQRRAEAAAAHTAHLIAAQRQANRVWGTAQPQGDDNAPPAIPEDRNQD